MHNTEQLNLPSEDFVGCKDPTLKKEPTFKYIEVEVTRTEGSIVYLKVPEDFDLDKIRRGHGMDSILVKACKQTLDKGDWDSNGWELDLIWQSIKEVSEKEAKQYDIYEVNQNENKKTK